MSKFYAAIDLKSFYASVECAERGLDPLNTHLVVADQSRTDKTICLAVSPSLKSYGLPGRARLFEVVSKVREINAARLAASPLHTFLGESSDHRELQEDPNLALSYIVATPRMRYYLDYSARIYQIYLQHVAPEDIFAYSVDEIFCDITSYLAAAHLSPTAFVSRIITQIYRETGITATAGIGTNLFLAKVAMDILAKHAEPDAHGARIAVLDEIGFRERLWTHTPITDFWRIGRGYARRLASRGLRTMGDVARCSLDHPELLYRLFGVNAELLIDHAWGYEPTEIHDVKTHRPTTKSISSGQVLSCPYDFSRARVIVREMAESITLELFDKGYLTDQLVLHIDYDRESSTHAHTTVTDHYGRTVPKPAHGTLRLARPTFSCQTIIDGFTRLFTQIVDPTFTVRKVTVCLANLVTESHLATLDSTAPPTQTDFFTDYAALERAAAQTVAEQEHARHLQRAILDIRTRYGKGSILRGTNFEDGATGRARYRQIGGHRA